MLNTYPLWKNLLIVFVLVFGVVYALPNIYPPDFAIQISTEAGKGGAVPQNVVDTAVAGLKDAGIEIKAADIENGNGLIRVFTDEDQLQGKEVVQLALHNLKEHYIVALNSAPTTPGWLADMGAQPMKYGLDLRGGVHFLLEVDTQAAIKARVDQLEDDVKRNLREENLRYKYVRVDGATLKVGFDQQDVRDEARTKLQTQFREFQFQSGFDDAYYLTLTVTQQTIDEIQTFAVQQNVQTIRNRINDLGVAEPLVQQLGGSRIVVDLPGVQDTAEAKERLGKVATLEFRMEALPDAPRSTTLPYDYEGRTVQLERNIIVRGDRVIDAQVGYDQNSGLPQVNLTLDGEGGEKINRATRNNVGRRMAVIYIETKTRDVLKMVDGEKKLVPEPYIEKRIISLATVQSALGVKFRITGLTAGEARELSALLRAGALAADMFIVEERTVGASLGQQNIEQGAVSVTVGMGLVLLFMLGYYRVFGLAANIALITNLILLVALMSTLSATLTMPGIAGIVLTVGMAVDANVLIFSRIKEEVKNGMSPQSAINAGFERAFVTILDANLTTLIVALILFSIGTGPIKGFAVTLSIGILTSMFTAIMVTRAIVNLIYGRRKVTKLLI
ncbi:MAG: protein translocase subunit SecD [Pseudomonadales bacterium]|nr:protein translocase subunit SecD [Pseudomonadales bacterium]